ncbi:MAG: DrmE family protein, partial [Deltaproteobacteria bacterium]|nr:DrmE family protein [Deltaproteobacteria bacterium]
MLFNIENLIDKCDIFFEDSLISKELIINNYAKFIAYSNSDPTDLVKISLHTNSICFNVISLLVTAFNTISLDKTNTDSILDSINIGDIVLYRGIKDNNKREKYVFLGYADINQNIVQQSSNNAKFIMLSQPNKRTKLKRYIRNDNWHLISPYKGDNINTDGLGISPFNISRSIFLSYIFNVHYKEIPLINTSSSVIVTSKQMYNRIVKGIHIIYDNDKTIAFSDFITTGYYTTSKIHLYGNNSEKIEPILKVTSQFSRARNLILEKESNQNCGLLILDNINIDKNNTELIDLINRKSL